MKNSLLLVALCTLVISCREDEASTTAPDSPTPPTTQEPQQPGEPQEPEEQPKDEITIQQLKDLGRFLFGGPISQAQATSAHATMARLTLATEGFYEEYQYLPVASESAVDKVLQTAGPDGSPLMAALLGLRSAQDENPRLLAFFETQLAEDKKDGLHRTDNTADLYDPWGKPYSVLLNYDNDNQLRDPLDKSIVLFDRRVLVWSNGPDGKSGTPETNKDNIYSWYRD